MMLQPNEFTDSKDSIGFFELDFEPGVYLTLNELKQETTEITKLSGHKVGILKSWQPIPKISYLPMFELNLELANKMMTAERSKYTLFVLLGDIGGFNGAIMILPAYLMSFYSEKMYQQAVAGQTPVRSRRKRRRNGQSAPFKLSNSVMNGE